MQANSVIKRKLLKTKGKRSNADVLRLCAYMEHAREATELGEEGQYLHEGGVILRANSILTNFKKILSLTPTEIAFGVDFNQTVTVRYHPHRADACNDRRPGLRLLSSESPAMEEIAFGRHLGHISLRRIGRESSLLCYTKSGGRDMCVVSMIMDHGQRFPWERPTAVRPSFTDWTRVPTQRNEELAKLLSDLLRKAAEYDRTTGQPACEDADKKRKLKDLADELGIRISFPDGVGGGINEVE